MLNLEGLLTIFSSIITSINNSLFYVPQEVGAYHVVFQLLLWTYAAYFFLDIFSPGFREFSLDNFPISWVLVHAYLLQPFENVFALSIALLALFYGVINLSIEIQFVSLGLLQKTGEKEIRNQIKAASGGKNFVEDRIISIFPWTSITGTKTLLGDKAAALIALPSLIISEKYKDLETENARRKFQITVFTLVWLSSYALSAFVIYKIFFSDMSLWLGLERSGMWAMLPSMAFDWLFTSHVLGIYSETKEEAKWFLLHLKIWALMVFLWVTLTSDLLEIIQVIEANNYIGLADWVLGFPPFIPGYIQFSGTILLFYSMLRFSFASYAGIENFESVERRLEEYESKYNLTKRFRLVS